MASRSSPPRRGCSTTSRSRSSRGRSGGCRCAVARAGRPVERGGDRRPDLPVQLLPGRGLDLAFLSFAEVDLPGTSTSASSAPPPRVRRVHRHLPERQGGRLLRPVREGGGHARGERAPPRGRPRAGGEVRKQVEHVTFSGPRAAAGGSPCARHRAGRLRPRPAGVELLELAPGCDLERDVLAEMEFRPIIAPTSDRWTPRSSSRDARAPRAVGCLVAWSRGRLGARRDRRTAALPVRPDRRRRGGGDPHRRHADGAGRRGFCHRRRRPRARPRPWRPGTPSPRCTRAARPWPRARRWTRSRC